MSRIPKIGAVPKVGTKDVNLQENSIKPPVESTSRNNFTGFKRPSDDRLHLKTENKKPKIETTVVKNKPLRPIQQSTMSDKAKRAALQPLPDTGLIRSSMPAVVSSAKIKVPGKPKRPAWDLKGRIQDMEEHFVASQEVNMTLKQAIEESNQRIAALEAANSELHRDVEIKSVQSEEAETQLNELRNQLKKKCEENESLKNETEKLKETISSTKREYDQLKSLYHQETDALKSTITSLTSMKSGVEAQLVACKMVNETQQSEILQLQKEISELKNKCSSLNNCIETLEARLREEETVRRKLHNTVQELKGNIRVFCRMRPVLPKELQSGMVAANIVAVSEKSIEIQQLSETGLNESATKMQPKYEFSFDCYFPPSTSQEHIFGEISQLVQSALDGYNVCIFAYGQTGSGKTYTMEGPADITDFIENKDHPQLGMIPRSVQQIFSTINELESKGWKYKVEALFLEIYNEKIKDLLNYQAGDSKCEIVRSGSKGNDCIVSNVTTSEVTSCEQVYELMKKARTNRVVAATKCNEYSSRSHYVFQMKINGENIVTGEKCDGILNLVDLAGSERVKESESAGNRLTEAKAINKSLSNLGKVIMSLSRKENHIPYRDSKLTHLLANSLGGNSKTLMFVNISPDSKNLNETINSLRFATKVNQCNIGTAQKRVK